jgi:hypothetical protein
MAYTSRLYISIPRYIAYIYFGFVLSLTSLTVTILQKNTYIRYLITILKFSMKYVLIMHLFEL